MAVKPLRKAKLLVDMPYKTMGFLAHVAKAGSVVKVGSEDVGGYFCTLYDERGHDPHNLWVGKAKLEFLHE